MITLSGFHCIKRFIFFAGQCLSRLRGHDPEGAEADGFVDQESGDGHQERGQVTHRAR